MIRELKGTARGRNLDYMRSRSDQVRPVRYQSWTILWGKTVGKNSDGFYLCEIVFVISS